MANLVPVLASVIDYQAGATNYGVAVDAAHQAYSNLTAGELVYLDNVTTNQWKPSIATGAVGSGVGSIVGVCLVTSLAGQPVQVQTAGPIKLGCTLAVGTQYYLSASSGDMCLYSDLSTGNYVTEVGQAISTTVMVLNPNSLNVTHP